MTFEWDEGKNQLNIGKHGLDLADGEELFNGRLPLLVAPDTAEEYGEDRWIGIGTINGRVVVVIFTERGPDAIRLISLRKANQEEKRRYEEVLKDELGQG
jgi:uncharacterized DUF497 family protein